MTYDDTKPSMPKPFDGTIEQAAANYNTHMFRQWTEGEYECDNCMSKPWHTAAAYPCGTSVPRVNAPEKVIANDSKTRYLIGVALLGNKGDQT